LEQSHLHNEVVYNAEEDIDPDSSEDEEHQHPNVVQMGELRKREMQLARKVLRKWWRLAGLPGHAEAADALNEGEMEVNWTHVSHRYPGGGEGGADYVQAIAPRLEGRIRMVTEDESGNEKKRKRASVPITDASTKR
jgi:5'-nucleotidase